MRPAWCNMLLIAPDCFAMRKLETRSRQHIEAHADSFSLESQSEQPAFAMLHRVVRTPANRVSPVLAHSHRHSRRQHHCQTRCALPRCRRAPHMLACAIVQLWQPPLLHVDLKPGAHLGLAGLRLVRWMWGAECRHQRRLSAWRLHLHCVPPPATLAACLPRRCTATGQQADCTEASFNRSVPVAATLQQGYVGVRGVCGYADMYCHC